MALATVLIMSKTWCESKPELEKRPPYGKAK
jgi:hypothetical protein